MKKWINIIQNKGFEIGLVCLLSFYAMVSLYTTTKEISQKQYISYTCSVDNKEYFVIGYGDYDFKIIPRAEKIQKYNILVQENMASEISGQIGYAIRTTDGKELTSGILDVKNVRSAGAIELSMNDINLDRQEEYIVRLYSRITGEIKIAFDSNAEPCNKQIFLNTYTNVYYAIVAIIILIILLLTFATIKYKEKDFFFVCFSMVVGVALIFMKAPCTAPDEFRHFLRAYSISEGVITCKEYTTSDKYYYQTLAECEIPKEIFEIKLMSESCAEHWTYETNSLVFFPEYLNQLMDNDDEELVTVPYHGASEISPIAYIPQILFILLAKVLGFNGLKTYYMACIGNLIFSTLLMYVARKICRKYKALYTILFFVPGLTFLRSSCSTDGILFSITVLLIAYLLEIEYNPKKSFVSVKTYLFTVLLLSIMALIKVPYVLLVCIILCFDVDKFAYKLEEKTSFKRLRQMLFLLSLIFVSCAVYISSNMYLSRFSEVTSSKASYITYFFTNPFDVCSLLVDTFFSTFMDYMESAFCFPHGGGYYIIYLLIILYFALKQDAAEDVVVRRKRFSYFVFVGLAMWMAILGVFYLVGPSPDLGYIWGVQGRYMFPIIPVLMIGLSNCSLFENGVQRLKEEKYYYYILIVLFVFILDTYKLYWL